MPGCVNNTQGKQGMKLLSLSAARANRARLDFSPFRPRRPGLRPLCRIDLATLVRYIDWGPFFQTWDLPGRYPKILSDATVGEQARAVFADAQTLLQDIVEKDGLNVNAVFGLFPANAVDDDIEIYADESRDKVLMTWHSLRQQHERPSDQPNQCLADFIAPHGYARLHWRLCRCHNRYRDPAQGI